jgi:hypothetical protein
MVSKYTRLYVVKKKGIKSYPLPHWLSPRSAIDIKPIARGVDVFLRKAVQGRCEELAD